jgi:hypothetical protein
VQRKPPQPLAQSFLPCREILQDRLTGEYVLIGPFTGLKLPAFPAAVRLSLYIKLTGGHGTYRMTLQLRDQEGTAVAECPGAEPVHCADPLAPRQICWRDLVLQFPRPGRYDLILLANDEDLTHHALDVALNASA